MDLLSDDILRAIFKNLWIGDRVRSRLVCKSWKQILTQDYIPKMPEAPWQILSDDSYKKSQSRLKEILFKSLSERRTYSFRLPLSICDGRGWWCCGSSRGWLLIAVGANLNASMFLWQPLSGETRKLPPVSTLPFFNEFIELDSEGLIDNLSSVVHRVEVFSTGSTECIVAVIFRRDEWDEIAICTPQEETWKIFGGGQIQLRYADMIFHSVGRRLTALATSMPPEDELANMFSNNKPILMTEGCCILVSLILLPLDVTSISEAPPERGLQLVHSQKQILHLVESSLTQELLFVTAWLDYVANENQYNEPIARFRCQQTTQFTVRTFGSSENPELENMSSIGEETIFVGDAGSYSIPTVDGVCADCIYFATNDAEGLALHSDANKRYVIREHGVFSLKRRKMQSISSTSTRFVSGSRVGWFMPQL